VTIGENVKILGQPMRQNAGAARIPVSRLLHIQIAPFYRLDKRPPSQLLCRYRSPQTELSPQPKNPLLTLYPDLEFLLVSDDYATLSAVTAGTKQLGAHLALVPTAEAAREFLARRRIDGVFVDMQLHGAQAMIEGIRKGSSNAKAAIFACVADAKESTNTLNSGANFLLRKPLTAEAVTLHITIAKDIMLREKRRFFRHPADLAITLKTGDATEQHVKIVNLSEGGMAVRTGKTLKPGGSVEFAFELAAGEELRGKGLVAWTSSEGLAGILIQSLHGLGRGYLERWLRARENLGADRRTSADRS